MASARQQYARSLLACGRVRYVLTLAKSKKSLRAVEKSVPIGRARCPQISSINLIKCLPVFAGAAQANLFGGESGPLVAIKRGARGGRRRASKTPHKRASAKNVASKFRRRTLCVQLCPEPSFRSFCLVPHIIELAASFFFLMECPPLKVAIVMATRSRTSRSFPRVALLELISS